jgi:hypothetical protein
MLFFRRIPKVWLMQFVILAVAIPNLVFLYITLKISYYVIQTSWFIKRQANVVVHSLARSAISWLHRCTFETLHLCINPLLNG